LRKHAETWEWKEELSKILLKLHRWSFFLRDIFVLGNFLRPGLRLDIGL
jgi:hypothetical protein